MWKKHFEFSDEIKKQIREAFPLEGRDKNDIWYRLFSKPSVETDDSSKEQTEEGKILEYFKNIGQCVSFGEPSHAQHPVKSHQTVSKSSGLSEITDTPHNQENRERQQNDELPDSVVHHLLKLKDYLIAHGKEDHLDQKHFRDEFCIMEQLSTDQVSVACTEYLSVHSIGECGVVLLCHLIASMEPEIGYNLGVTVIRNTLFPLVSELSSNATRMLNDVCQLLSQKHPKIFIEGLLVPLIERKHIETPQINLLVKSLKFGMNQSELPQVLMQALHAAKIDQSEGLIEILHCIIERMPNQEKFPSALSYLLCQLFHDASRYHSKSLKFSKLLHLTFPKLENQLNSAQVDMLSSVVKENGTFMKKLLEKSLTRFNKV